MSRAVVPTIGLEVHARLATGRKLFCRCAVVDDAPPNAHTCPVCRGEPGTLPVLDPDAIRLATRAALALDFAVAHEQAFHRKHYTWPDLPKGFQITGQLTPLGRDGTLHVDPPVQLTALHVEEDAGRFSRRGERLDLDDNRAGAPLVEITTAPTLVNAQHAEAAARLIHRTLVAAGVTEGRLEQGHLRIDVNLSLDGGARVEVKNLGSFRSVRDVLEHELHRQAQILADGVAVRRATRGWDGEATFPLRDKEATADYRFLPEPNVPPAQVVVPADATRGLDLALRMGDGRHRARLERLGVRAAGLIADAPQLLAWFDEALEAGADPVEVGHWLAGPVRALANEHDHAVGLTGARLARLVAMVEAGSVSRSRAKDVLAVLWREVAEPEAVVAHHGWTATSDVAGVVAEVLEAHPDEVARHRAGETQLFGWFMGRVMARTGGTADPGAAHAFLRAALADEAG